MKRVLVTGAAGFLGYHVSRRLLEGGCSVLGVDSLNSYYDPRLKRARLDLLGPHARFQFSRLDLADRRRTEALFERERFDAVIHLAAQAGVRYSIENPHVYIEANITAFLQVLEGVRRGHAGHLIYASSSSVYGGNRKIPFAVEDRCDQPVSLYAATKRADELMAYCYVHQFGIAATGLRFFTVYGPWSRPDMAPYRFAQAIECGQRIDIYNYGRMQRDFTYVGDVAEGVFRVLESGGRGHRLFNVGGNSPVGLMEFVHELERALGKRARRRFLPMQPGDVPATHSEAGGFEEVTGFRPATPLRAGIESFAAWFREWSRAGQRSESVGAAS